MFETLTYVINCAVPVGNTSYCLKMLEVLRLTSGELKVLE